MKLYTILGSFLGLSLCMTIASCHSPQPTSEITWSTFNIRYDNPYDSLNSWTYRKDTVANFIKAQNLDIVGMQEVLHHQLEDLKSAWDGKMERHKANMPLCSIKKTVLNYWTTTPSGCHNTPTV